jgi:biopolymer transport protein ExbD
MVLKRRSTGSIGLNLTSMIDVVFLLLIYFMAATEFRTAEESFPMDLPIRDHGQSLMLDREPLVILVESTGQGQHDVRLRLEGPWEPVPSVSELFAFLRSNMADGIGSGGLFTQAHPILIRPTPQTRWDHTLAIYNTAAKANYTNITLDEPS